jgi:hypothetical protein
METVNYGRNKFYDTGPWCHIFIVMQNFVMLRVILWSAIMLSVIILKVAMLKV